MITRLFFLTFICIYSHLAIGQVDIDPEERPAWKDRIYFGGGGTFQLDNHIFVLGASPIVGYMFTPKFSSGVGVTYQYARYKFLEQSAHTYGSRVFSRYNLFRSVYTMAEYEMLNVGLPRSQYDIPRRWVERFLVGGGYFQRFPGRRGGFNMGIFYDVLFQYGRFSPYSSPWVYRVGLTF